MNKKNKLELKITARDQDGNVIYETSERSADNCYDGQWDIAILWSDGLERELRNREKMANVTTLTITAERVQTDVKPPDPVAPQTTDDDDDETEDIDPFDDDGDEEDNHVTVSADDRLLNVTSCDLSSVTDETQEGPTSVKN